MWFGGAHVYSQVELQWIKAEDSNDPLASELQLLDSFLILQIKL